MKPAVHQQAVSLYWRRSYKNESRSTKLMAIFAEWNAVDWDLNELFEAIKSNDYESYFKVKSALLDDECTEKSERF